MFAGYKTYTFAFLLALLVIVQAWGWIEFTPELYDTLFAAFGFGTAFGIRDAIK